MIWSYLQGHMGRALADDKANPRSAQIVTGDICFFAGVPNDALIEKADAPEIVPQNDAWSRAIERVLGDGVRREFRYAIKKEDDGFDHAKLTAYTRSLPEGFSLALFNEAICHMTAEESWSRDFCALFNGSADFVARGLGVAVLYRGRPVAGASSYLIYDGGIEIEIDTKPDFRRRGLATACGARLILECLRRGLYPSWDAYDLRSLALAEKLGYRLDHPYAVYRKTRQSI
jgi:GNAT superfamily N-acetyltransferase